MRVITTVNDNADHFHLVRKWRPWHGARILGGHEDRLSRAFVRALRPRLASRETAAAQVEALGFSRRDVRHIVLTHLDFDHAGGIEDFPGATVHVHEDELRAAKIRGNLISRGRYRPRQWNRGVNWVTYRPAGEAWFDFPAVHQLRGLPPDILMIPLVGHTQGHCGVALRDGNGWSLAAGDAYFHRREMHVKRPHCPPGLRLYQRLMEVDRVARRGNQIRLRELNARQAGRVRIFSAHDRSELVREARRMTQPLRKAG